MVVEVSKQVSVRFPRSVLREDCEQDIWLWALSNKDSITRTIEDHPKTWVQQVASTMRKQAMKFCVGERDAAESRDSEDFQKYGLAEVRTLLMDVFDYEDWQSFATVGDGQPRSKALVNTTGDRLASLVDVKIALGKIPESQYNLIVWHFKYGYTYDELAAEYETTVDGARKRVERSVKAVQRALGTKPSEEFTGRRTVRSNAAWRAASSNRYEGE